MIYVHVPFCRSFCTYCGFYSEICKAGDSRIEEYAGALIREIQSRAHELAVHDSGENGRNTLYIGGGTPSVLPLPVLGRIVSRISDAVPSVEWEEFTVEVNPDDIVRAGAGYAHGLRGLGVTRVSMGVQSFDPQVLRWMNRRHSPEDAERAFTLLRSAGFKNISIDLIFGFGGSAQQWSESLGRALELRPEHISAYQLSIEEGSAIEEMIARGSFAEAPEEECRAQYDELCLRLAEAGYEHYEVSNFALPGRRAVHNSGYWVHSPYVGLGAAAHSFDGHRRSWNPADLGAYLAAWPADGAIACPRAGSSCAGSEALSAEQLALEDVMLGLRTCEGVDADRMHAIADPSALKRFLESGAVVCEEGRIRIPEDHFFVSDDIIRELM